jgi:polyisoprenoid-binding protein YceI
MMMVAALMLVSPLATAQPVRSDTDSFLRAYVFSEEIPYNTIIFESRAKDEIIVGASRSASGYVMVYDEGRGVEFLVEVPVESLNTGIELRDQALASRFWLDGEQFPEIVFTGTSTDSVGSKRYMLRGAFTMHGQTKQLYTVATVGVVQEVAAAALGLADGNWISVRSTFHIKLSDYGITVPPIARDRVADEWTVHVRLYAQEQ